MKRYLFAVICFCVTFQATANHITGGQIYYTFTGRSGDQYSYNVALLLYRDSASNGAQLDGAAPIAIFDRGTNVMVWNNTVPIAFKRILHLWSPGHCITNPPSVVYEVGYYTFSITLPASLSGYVVTYQRCCRIAGINNLVASSSIGATYIAIIPGTGSRSDGPENSSARFIGSDTVVVCGGYPFTYSFAAEDPDQSDHLYYSFCDAYVGGGQGQGPGPNSATPNPPAAPPYTPVSYNFPYSGSMPLGSGISINSSTGLITGIAPPEGIYVVTVCVSEVRNGVIIATQRKDLQIKAGDCEVAAAALNPEYISCDGFTVSFTNLSSSSLINSYSWDFGDPASGVNNNAVIQRPTHTFSAAGDYNIKLVTNRGQECSDSTNAVVRVWPGFFPGFSNTGICLQNPVLFMDGTTTNYGVVNSWRWNFGDASTIADTAISQNSSWTYADKGVKGVRLIVTNSKGCIDTVSKDVAIIDKPPITLAFRDTLICIPDAVQLQAAGTGVFSWTPGVNIINANSATPTVNPTLTTTYHVQLNEQGCINNDSVKIRVVSFVTLAVMSDTTICTTDSVQLRATGDGLRYTWSPSAAFINPNAQTPVAIAGSSNNYTVTATIGSCSASRNIGVIAVPYPMAHAGRDTIICYDQTTVLNGSHDGDSLRWSPAGTLSSSTALHPVAHPLETTSYVLSSWANNGCPKPGRDTVIVSVMPRIRPQVTNDTLVVVGQPLQLFAAGGVSYLWRPSTGLNNSFINNPVATYNSESDTVRYTVFVYDSLGCVDSDYLRVVVFKTNPYVFVPTAFTPNGDGRNDILRPIAVGVKEIRYFAIYNRWGELLFKTDTDGAGWDGRVAGMTQGTNVFVWMVSAIDYLGKPIFIKGTVTLIN